MHVLRQIHKALRPGGFLLDIHPQPKDPRVEIQRDEDSVVVGTIDWTQDSKEIRQARRRLEAIQREGLFRFERRRFFDLRAYHQDVDAWLDHRREKAYSDEVSSAVLRAARRALRTGGGRVVVIERIRASALRRLDVHTSSSAK